MELVGEVEVKYEDSSYGSTRRDPCVERTGIFFGCASKEGVEHALRRAVNPDNASIAVLGNCLEDVRWAEKEGLLRGKWSTSLVEREVCLITPMDLQKVNIQKWWGNSHSTPRITTMSLVSLDESVRSTMVLSYLQYAAGHPKSIRREYPLVEFDKTFEVNSAIASALKDFLLTWPSANLAMEICPQSVPPFNSAENLKKFVEQSTTYLGECWIDGRRRVVNQFLQDFEAMKTKVTTKEQRKEKYLAGLTIQEKRDLGPEMEKLPNFERKNEYQGRAYDQHCTYAEVNTWDISGYGDLSVGQKKILADFKREHPEITIWGRKAQQIDMPFVEDKNAVYDRICAVESGVTTTLDLRDITRFDDRWYLQNKIYSLRWRDGDEINILVTEAQRRDCNLPLPEDIHAEKRRRIVHNAFRVKAKGKTMLKALKNLRDVGIVKTTTMPIDKRRRIARNAFRVKAKGKTILGALKRLRDAGLVKTSVKKDR